MRWMLPLPIVLLTGCPDRPISAVPSEQGTVQVIDLPAVQERDVDLLFVIDNSRSMKDEQDSLNANFARFVEVLQSIHGGMPNMHIGVVTSDLGSQTTDGGSAGPDAFGCTAKGDDGALRPLANGLRFIVDESDGAGGRRRNYDGELTAAFSEIASVGIEGCGIEQHLGAVERALVNPLNAGFLRKDAYLAVVIIADEDDCSQAHPGLFAGTTNPVDINFRCTDDGVECDAPTTPFRDGDGLRMNCHPKASRQWVESTDRYVAALRTAKGDPNSVIVAGIVGAQDRFNIKHDGDGNVVLDYGCKYTPTGATSEQIAFPAIRIASFLSAFPAHSTNQTICQDDLSDPIGKVADVIRSTLEAHCLTSELVDVDPFTDGLQFSCSVSEMHVRSDGSEEEIAILPSCLQDNTRACWNLIEDPASCSFTETQDHLRLDVDWKGRTLDAGTRIRANCLTVAGDDGPLR